jgi:8-oxo-dGTP diphosphatase / 2-hydroxy-dATP diphosphatase
MGQRVKKVMTLVVVYTPEKILLGMKKRGFGAGRWNGFGGKMHEGESLEEAARRELLEEVGIVPNDLQARGQLTFTFEENDDELEVHLFSVTDYSGEPVETDEMASQWFAHSEIPYPEMWTEDPHWLPQLLAGKSIRGAVHFDNPDSQKIVRKNIASYE